ncbi:ABC transporter substrate-binding protein [Brevibacterium sp. 50QC2O2]|uniref:siderophore ABC transporter substrate-binding protein n=1 Tax=Brevibacterium TaxID=1696 RepID=UPI00211C1859|nr:MULTISPECIES: ABC transporter substrate-binding protein [unclassified Brevibacterium]MCQ9369352.1 ABC transporter substrate-binding protein [Brevibacterium sp. 91QC2O2]MCQ9386518.1 ABC transporter substrate-binding protein [Brevibacterium sp. 68QC2CO]MCQ9389671.1 ABC transporter substrate-binding protein [Brevibacterium sp. 50QC2O2]
MSLKTRHSVFAIAASAALALGLSACGGTDSDSAAQGETVTITDNSGEVQVPLDPEKYAVTDNISFHTLSDWGKKPVAAPRTLMPDTLPWEKDDSIADSGSHREPDLEKIVGAEPQMVINGYRYSSQQDKLKELLGDKVPVVTFDRKDDEGHIDNLKRHTEQLGKIFKEEDSAKQKNDDLDASIAKAKKAYDGKSSVMGLTTSGGEINYSDPKEGRGASVLFEALGLKSALNVDKADGTDKGNKVSVETIAKANPDWLIVMDRDAAIAKDEKGYKPSTELLKKNAALKNVTAVKKNQIMVLPDDFYEDEGIECFTGVFNDFAKAQDDAK